MSAEAIGTKEMGVIGRIIGVFASPKETFENIDRKPTWLVPFIIIVLVAIAMQFLVMDIGMKDQIAKMEARGVPQEQLDMIQQRMAGPTKYVQFGVIPIATLAMWAIIGGILLMGSNSIMGGSATFKKIFALQAWTSLIGVVAAVLKTVLILSKGTTQGVARAWQSCCRHHPSDKRRPSSIVSFPNSMSSRFGVCSYGSSDFLSSAN